MIDKQDIQGFIKQGYGYLNYGRYLLVKIVDAAGFKQWLETHIDDISTAAQSDLKQTFNIAFTRSGLQRLSLPEDSLQSFAREWYENMVTPERSYRLGDTQHNAPENWQWGAPHQTTIDALLFGFFETSKGCKAWQQTIESFDFLEVIEVIEPRNLPQFKEHFGFRDGISQPTVKGMHKEKEKFNALATGEFILGHKNEYDEVAPCPVVNTNLDKHLQLKTNRQGDSLLGFNGSYLVFRQLEQDVHAFWDYVDQQSKDEYNKSHPQQRLLFASKMVGRWPNGKMIKPGATAQPSTGISNGPENQFTYENDTAGFGCPIGSHIRRSNPRATLDGQKKAKDAIKTANRHRILRRGRPYGEPIVSSMQADEILEKGNDDAQRGLLFLCLNADIARQFEFVQQTWLNNSKFRSLYTEVDPIAGIKPDAEHLLGNHFSIQGKPFRQRLRQVPSFITMKGGAYFFLPSIRALKFLSTLEDEA
ncbi:MAG: peroxidase [Pseudomonadales bacterium]|nr:peroxidase [Pseudomonadales bacterium]